MISYYTGEMLFDALASSINQNGIKEVIRNKKINCLTGHGNISFAKACNLGAKNATGKFLGSLTMIVLYMTKMLG